MADKIWQDLFSMVTEYFKRQGDTQAYLFCKKASIDVDYYGIDSFEVEYYTLELYFDFFDYLSIIEPDKYSNEITELMNKLNPNPSIYVERTVVKPFVERIYDWDSIAPSTKESTIELINQEKEMLIDVATGRLSYKLDGVEEEFEKRHNIILDVAKRVGFEYPVNFRSLVDWWVYIRRIETYAERTSHINQLFSQILDPLIKATTEETTEKLDFSALQNRRLVIDIAIKDADVLIKNRSYVSAIDRIHTAFHGYIESLLDTHGIEYNEGETLQTLYSKLHSFYEKTISPQEMATIVKTLLRGASGIVNSINDIRNTLSVSHPNDELIQEREAKLMTSLVLSVVQYIEDIERNCYE